MKKFLIPLFFLISLHGQDKEVVALGAAITDYFLFLSEEEFSSLAMEKGSWMPAEPELISSLLQNTLASPIPGGSAVNVIKGLASLGNMTKIIGKIGNDPLGESYREKLHAYKIQTDLHQGDLPSGRALCLVTPDGQKTMRTFLGASHLQGDIPLPPSSFEKASHLHVEGYQILDPLLLDHVLLLAEEKGVTISMDLGNFELVKKNLPLFLSLIEKHVDVLFCNEEEAKVLSKGMAPMDAAVFLSRLAKVVVVTMGGKGGWVKSQDKLFHYPAISTQVVDTTGAGDFFSAGFLHGFLQGEPLEKCAFLGALLASKIVQIVGTELSDGDWKEVKEKWALLSQPSNLTHSHK